MAPLKEVFDKAAEHVKSVKGANQDDQKYLYARFKQANVGDCNTGRPGLFNMRERVKWDAWNGLKGKSGDEAMREYVAKVDKMAGSAFSSEVDE